MPYSSQYRRFGNSYIAPTGWGSTAGAGGIKIRSCGGGLLYFDTLRGGVQVQIAEEKSGDTRVSLYTGECNEFKSRPLRFRRILSQRCSLPVSDRSSDCWSQ